MSFNVVLPQTPGANSALIAVVGLTDSGGAAAVTSIVQGAATWQLAVQGGTGDERIEIWYSLDAEGETTTIQINTVADQDEKAIVTEWFGVFAKAGAALDRTATSSGNDAAPAVGPTAETTNPEELFIGAFTARGALRIFSAPTNGFTLQDQVTSLFGGDEVSLGLFNKIVEATEQAQLGATLIVVSPWGGAVATFFAEPPADVITLLGVTPTEIAEDGGYQIDIEGDFSNVLGQDIEVFIGPNGDEQDTLCYSGIPGSPTTVTALSPSLLRAYSPRLDLGLQSIFVRTVDESAAGLLENSITVFKRGFETSVFDMRRVLPPWYRTGPRQIEEEEF